MSWSAHLLECSFAFGKEVFRPPGEPARWGSAIHELLAALIQHGVAPARRAATVAKRLDVKSEGLAEHTVEAHGELNQWLKKNQFRIDFTEVARKGTVLVEHAVALLPGVSGRVIPAHDDNHRYHGLQLGEQPGTLDYAVIPAKRVQLPLLVLDHKTGEEDFSRPLDKAQLLSLVAAVMRWTGRDEAIVGVLHARRRGMPRVYADRVKLTELARYERMLQTAMGRIGDGSMKPGPKCDYCPAKSVCPAKDAELLARAGDILTGLTAAGGALSSKGLIVGDLASTALRAPAVMSVEKKLGLLYEIARKAEILAARSRDEIKKAILDSDGTLLPETSEGYLIVREYDKENVSKDSIVKAYGKVQGERMLTKLRDDGAITTSHVQQLWPEKERGR